MLARASFSVVNSTPEQDLSAMQPEDFRGKRASSRPMNKVDVKHEPELKITSLIRRSHFTCKIKPHVNLSNHVLYKSNRRVRSIS